MVYDNHLIPVLLARPRLMFDDKQSSCAVDAFMTTASEATRETSRDDESSSIPSLFGQFDQRTYADGMVKAGYPNPLRSEWQGLSIPWLATGKIQAQGVAFSCYTPLLDNWLSTGFNCLFMRVNTYHYFKLPSLPALNNDGNRQELDERRRFMFDQVGLTHNYSSQVGFGDIDWYLRLGRRWDYSFKCRSFDIGGRLGTLIPSGKKRDLNNPNSIPFGGNGHWGIYGTIDGLLELREDLKFGFMVRVSKRFPKISCQRLPVNNEPEPFGIITGLAQVNPGFTFIFSPLIALENLREGMGASIQYTMTKHLQDDWCDARTDKTTVPITLGKINELSKWSSDYFTINVFYDFGKMKVRRSGAPILSVRWDVPAALFITDNIPNMHRVSIGVEWVF